MIQTKYFCDLCGSQIEEMRQNLMRCNVTLHMSTPDHSEEHHVCEDCISNLNPYEIIDELQKKKKVQPGFKKPEVWQIVINTIKYKTLSIGEN